MTSEQLEVEERANKTRHRAEKYSGLAMIIFGLAGGVISAIAGGEITRYYHFFEQHHYMGDLCTAGCSAFGAAFGLIVQDKFDPIKKYLDRRAKLSELELKKLKENKN
jgi:hypothetical protein